MFHFSELQYTRNKQSLLTGENTAWMSCSVLSFVCGVCNLCLDYLCFLMSTELFLFMYILKSISFRQVNNQLLMNLLFILNKQSELKMYNKIIKNKFHTYKLNM